MSSRTVFALLTSSVVAALGVVGAPSAALADRGVIDFSAQPTLRQFALAHNGGSLDWVPGTGVEKSAWNRALRDNTIRVDDNGDAFVVESAASYPDEAEVAAAGTPIDHSTIPLTDAFLLHSDPTASRVIYLDFTGMNITGTAWAYSYGLTGTQTDIAAYDIDGDPTTFSSTERQNIIDTWSAVAEDFATFDVDVTTVEPSQSLIDRASSTDQYFGTRALITSGSNAIYDSCGCGGIAYVGTFDSYGVPSGWYNPAFAFTASWFNGKIISDIVSHEVGHNLGLAHDGFGTDGYYLGRDGWAPIMGAGYYEPLVQWSNGDYNSSNQTQNDFAVMESNGAPYFADDVGNSRDSATAVDARSTTNAVIGTRTDVDVFRFVATKYAHTISVTSPSVSSDLDVQMTVTDSNGTVVAASNPTMTRTDNYTMTGLDASVIASVTPGSTYFVSIDGVGQGDSATGYSDYGSVGQYTLVIAPGPLPDMIPGTVSISGSGVFGTTISGSPGTWPTGAIVTTEWLRNGVGTGDTDGSYSPTASDVGATIALRVTATKTDYNTAVVTSSAITVSRASLTLTPTPTISGDSTFGSNLTLTTGSWDSGVTLEVTWLRNGSATSNHSLEYSIGANDIGASISARVNGSKPGFTSVTRTSLPVRGVAATMSPTDTPTLVGITKVGKSLTVVTGTWMADVSFSYRWNRNGVAIPDAIGSAYRLTRKDDGKRITVTLTATHPGFTDVTVTSLPTRRIAS